MNRQVGLKPKVTKLGIILCSSYWFVLRRDKYASVSKMMTILSLLLCDQSACSGEFLSPESSDCNMLGVIIEMKKHAKWLTSYFLHRNWMNKKRKGKNVCKHFWGVYLYRKTESKLCISQEQFIYENDPNPHQRNTHKETLLIAYPGLDQELDLEWRIRNRTKLTWSDRYIETSPVFWLIVCLFIFIQLIILT